jgi:hypothetical protein
MVKLYKHITPELQAWIGQPQLFFIVTMPLAAGGRKGIGLRK